MKQTIGSVSALIALSAATASANIVAAPFSNVELNLADNVTIGIDMDGDGADDFDLSYYWENPGASLIAGVGTNEIVVADSLPRRYGLGTLVEIVDTGANAACWTNLVGEGVSWVGVKFQSGGQTHLGWIQFYLPDSSTGYLVRGAWENIPGNSIPAGGGWGNVTPSRGPFAGGNAVAVTSCAPAVGSGADITNVLVGAVSTTNLLGQGTNWIVFVAPPAYSAGMQGITVQSASQGGTILTDAYTYLPQNGWVAINITPAAGTWALSAPAGYTGPTTGTGNLSAASAITGQYTVGYGALSGYVAPSNQTQFAASGSTALFTAVYLQISTDIGTPAGVLATEGAYTNKIRITWQGVAGAAGYEIWRSQTNDANTAARIADIPVNQSVSSQRPEGNDPTFSFQLSVSSLSYYYDDYNVSQVYAYYYWVRARTASLISPMSYVGMGYAALDPRGIGGTADISVSDFVFLPVNITNQSNPGTISCWIQNRGPDNLSNSAVLMDVYMTNGAMPAAWLGNMQTNITLNAGAEKVIIFSPLDKQGIQIRADLSGVCLPEIHIRHLTTLYDPNMANNIAYGMGLVTVKSPGRNSPGRTINDYDGDGRSDLAVHATNMSAWGVLLSGARYGRAVIVEPGETDWRAVPGDYEGAGMTGVGIYVPDYGIWYVWFPSGGHGEFCNLGGTGYTPAQADYDGDNKTDPVVYRLADGYWRGYGSRSGYMVGETMVGGPGYEPVARDYDGDGLADPMTYTERSGNWIGQLTASQYGLVLIQHYGGPGYQAVPADYDGDGLADPAVYERISGMWYAALSSYGYQTVITQFGGLGLRPVGGDYDGDGLADPAVYCEATGVWYGALSSRGYLTSIAAFGGTAYSPISE